MYSKTIVTLLYGLVLASTTLAAPYPMPIEDDVDMTASQAGSAKSKGKFGIKNPFKGIGKSVQGAVDKVTGASKKDFEAKLKLESNVAMLRSHDSMRVSETFYLQDMIPMMLPYMQQYTKDNLKKIRDPSGVFNDYTTNVVVAGGKNEAVRKGCAKPSVMIAAGIVLGAYKSEKREDPRMEKDIFDLLSKTIETDSKKRTKAIDEMKKCETIIRENIDIDKVVKELPN